MSEEERERMARLVGEMKAERDQRARQLVAIAYVLQEGRGEASGAKEGDPDWSHPLDMARDLLRQRDDLERQLSTAQAAFVAERGISRSLYGMLAAADPRVRALSKLAGMLPPEDAAELRAAAIEGAYTKGGA